MAQVGITLSQEQIDKLYSQVQEIIKKIQTDDKITLDLDNVNKQIEEIKNQINGVSSDLKPIEFQVNTEKSKKAISDIKGTFEEVINQLNQNGKILDLTPAFNKNNGEIESFVAKLQETEGLIEKITVKARINATGEKPIPSDEFNVEKITEYDNRVNLLNKDLQELGRLKEQINNISSQKENESLQESLNLLKQDYNLERQINDAKQNGYNNLVKELEIQKEVNNSKFGKSASNLSNESTEKLIQQASDYQDKLNRLIAKQTDEQDKVNEKLDQEIIKFKDLASIKIQDLETQVSKASSNKIDVTSIENAISRLKELKENINSENFADSQQLFNTQLKQTEANLREINTQARNSKGVLDDILHNITEMAKWAIGGTAIFGTFNQLKDAVEYVNELNTSMTNIQMITDIDTQSTQKLVSQYRELAGEMGQNDTDFLKGAEEYLRAGLNDKDTSTMLKQNAIASAISGVSNSEMSENLIAMKNAYGLTANQIDSLIDKISTLDNKSSASFSGIADAMKRSAANAQEVGISYDKLASYITTVIDVTHRTPSTVGENFKTIFSRLTNVKAGMKDEDNLGINDVEKVLSNDRVNIKLRETSGEWRNMGDVIDNVAQKWGSFDSVTKSQIATVIAGKQQMSTFLSLMQNYDKEQQFEKDETEAIGSANKKYQEYLQSTGAKVNELKTTLHSLYADIVNSNAVNSIVSSGKNLVGTIDTLATKHQGLGVAVAGLTTAFISLAVSMKAGTYSTFAGEIATITNAFRSGTSAELGFVETTTTANTIVPILASGLNGITVAADAAMTALMTNPLTWIGIAIAGVIEFTNRLQQQEEATKEAKQAYADYKKAIANHDTSGEEASIQDMTSRMQKIADSYSGMVQKMNSSNPLDKLFGALNYLDANKEETALKEAGYAYDSTTGKIKDLQKAKEALARDKNVEKASRELSNSGINNEISQEIEKYNQLNKIEDKTKAEKEEQTVVVGKLKSHYSDLTSTIDSNGNTIIKNTSDLEKHAGGLVKDSNSAEKDKNSIKSLTDVENDLGSALKSAKSNIESVTTVLAKHASTGQWDYDTILTLAKSYPELLTAMGNDKSLTEALTQVKQKEIDTVEGSVKAQIELIENEVKVKFGAYGIDLKNFTSAEQAKTAIAKAEAQKRIDMLETKADEEDKKGLSGEADKDAQLAARKQKQLNSGNVGSVDEDTSALLDKYFNEKDLQAGMDKLFSSIQNQKDETQEEKAQKAQESAQKKTEEAENKRKQAQEKALEGQVKDLERAKKAYDDQMEADLKTEETQQDNITKGLQAQLDILQKKKEQQEEMNSLIKDQNDLVKAQQGLQNAQSQKIQIMDANGNLVWVTDESKVSSAREKLGEAQNNLNVEKNNQAEKHQEENINAQIKQVEAQKEAYKAQYDNNKSAKDKAYEAQIDALNQQKESIQGYKDGTDYAEQGVKHVAEDSIEIVIGNQLREFAGGEVVLNGAKTNQIMNGANKVANVSNQNGNNQVGTSNLNSQLNNMAKKAEQTTGDSINGNKQLVRKPVTDLKNEITNEITQYVNGIGQYSVEANKNVGTGINNSQDSVINPTKNLINTTKNLITTFAQNTINDGLEIDKQIGKGITDGEKDLNKIIDDLCQKMIDEFHKDLGIHSPSTVMRDVGIYMMQGLIAGLNEADISKFIQDKIGSMSSVINQQAVNVSGSLQDWIHQAMQLTNTPDSWFNGIATIAKHESDGDPNNVNTYDINAQEGHPSIGVMQMIEESFRENMVSGHNNIRNPIDNIASAINYIRHRYGDISNVPGIRSLARGGSYIGYKEGTPENGVPKTDMYKINEDTRDGSELVFLNEGDQVINSKRTSILKKIADIVGQTGSLDKALYTSNLGIDTSNISLPSNINLNVNKSQPIENKYSIAVENLNLPNAHNPESLINGMVQFVNTL